MYTIKFILCLFLAISLITGSNTYTISKDVTPVFPKAKLIHNKLVKDLPNGEEIVISCPDDTFLNKETLTCDFIVFSSEPDVSSRVYPGNDCRKFDLCDGNRCVEKSCPPPLLFNRILGVCDYPEMADCCEFDAKNHNRIIKKC
ncbi:uncharacterized protein LOC130894116 isoform X1 [Diorhabda carinulata]|uniref:uncharacterized protein LOC130894116 isoform X1 n=1 Tax=Diorhabda carinulata TaxID=1163345 RepID=UPI0025A193C2|nr:uncharacterized protein LOC130894116 isoform X1 [Diorhabda carinulata]